MVLAEAVIFWVVLALLFRRDLGAIAHSSFHGGWKLGAVVVGLFAAQALVVLYVPGQSVVQMAILTLSQVALLLFVVLNRHLPGAALFALGIVLNIVVMVANDGWMPITPEAYSFIHPERVVAVGERPPASKGVILPQSETRLWILSDIVAVELPWRRTAVSIGDILLIAGAGQFIFQATAGGQIALPAPAAGRET